MCVCGCLYVCVVRDESLWCVCQCTFGVLCVSFNFEGNDVNFSHKIAIRLGYVLDGFELWCVRGAQFEIVPIVGIGFLYQNCKNYLWKLPNHLLSEKWWSIFWSTGVLCPNRPKMVYYCYYVGILFVYEPGDFSGEKFSALRFPILILHKTHTSDNNFQFFRSFFSSNGTNWRCFCRAGRSAEPPNKKNNRVIRIEMTIQTWAVIQCVRQFRLFPF